MLSFDHTSRCVLYDCFFYVKMLWYGKYLIVGIHTCLVLLSRAFKQKKSITKLGFSFCIYFKVERFLNIFIEAMICMQIYYTNVSLVAVNDL